MARGARTQRGFAKILGVDPTCLSRYENEKLGAPTSVINFCLSEVVTSIEAGFSEKEPSPVGRALNLTRLALGELEFAVSNS